MEGSGFPRTLDILLKLLGARAWLLEVIVTMTGAGGPYNLGGSATTGIRATITNAIVVLPKNIFICIQNNWNQMNVSITLVQIASDSSKIIPHSCILNSKSLMVE